jgi:hypothetical protein
LTKSITKKIVRQGRQTRVVHIPAEAHNKLKLRIAKKGISGIKTSLGNEVANAIYFYLDNK